MDTKRIQMRIAQQLKAKQSWKVGPHVERLQMYNESKPFLVLLKNHCLDRLMTKAYECNDLATMSEVVKIKGPAPAGKVVSL